MKRGWIALLLIMLSLLLGGIEYLYVTANTDTYLLMLDEADEQVEQNRIAEALNTAEKLDYRFRKQSVIYDIFLYHSDVGNISSDLAMLSRYAKAGEVGEFLATSAKARREIRDLHNAKLLRWENIF